MLKKGSFRQSHFYEEKDPTAAPFLQSREKLSGGEHEQ